MSADTAHRNESPSAAQTRVYLDELTKLPREIHRGLSRLITGLIMEAKKTEGLTTAWAKETFEAIDTAVEALDNLLDQGRAFCALQLAEQGDDAAEAKALGLLVEQAR
jgi:hypothetical protein